MDYLNRTGNICPKCCDITHTFPWVKRVLAEPIFLVRSYCLSLQKTPLRINFKQQVITYNGNIKEQTFPKYKKFYFESTISINPSNEICNKDRYNLGFFTSSS